MTVAGFTIWLSLTFGGLEPPTFDVGGSVVLQAPVAALIRQGGIALPHVVLLNDATDLEDVRHELRHARQWDALGPAFLVAYAAGWGHGFEDYLGDGVMWEPPRGMRRACPLARFEPTRPAQLVPCWRWW